MLLTTPPYCLFILIARERNGKTGEAALSETGDSVLSPLASQKHTIVICNTGMLRLREPHKCTFLQLIGFLRIHKVV